MKACKEIGRWLEENIERPVEQFFTDWITACEDVRRWIETEVRRPIETWREQQESRCREEKCFWLCLCCNKLICWLVTILVRVVEWVIEVVGEWLIETVCKLIVIIIRTIVMIIVQILKWIVIAIVCILEAFCNFMFLFAGLALLLFLLALLVATNPLFIAAALPWVIPAFIAFAAFAVLAATLCEGSKCRVQGLVMWALKWAIVLGALFAVLTFAPASAMIAAIYGGIASAWYQWMLSRNCPVPRLLSMP